MLTITIDKNIPLPPARQGRIHKKTKYPLLLLKKGDSFFVAKISTKSLSAVACACAKRYKSRKFSVRQTSEKGQKGARVWRVA